MSDTISRQAAIDARRYTFGNDEFSLEAAYHDCKLVFDGITGDDSFQEADTGLILYYANEIIYALQEALEGKDTNVPTNDHISRKAAIECLEQLSACNEPFVEIGTNDETYIGKYEAITELSDLPSAERTGKWIPCSERLPEDNDYKPFSYYEDGAVLYCTTTGKVGFGWYYESTKQWANEDDGYPGEVVAWMPLPESARLEGE